MITTAQQTTNTTMTRPTKHRPKMLGSFRSLTDINPAVKKKAVPKARGETEAHTGNNGNSSMRSMKADGDDSSTSSRKVAGKKNDRSSLLAPSRPKSTSSLFKKKPASAGDDGSVVSQTSPRKSRSFTSGRKGVQRPIPEDEPLQSPKPARRGRKKELTEDGGDVVVKKVRSSSLGALNGARAKAMAQRKPPADSSDDDSSVRSNNTRPRSQRKNKFRDFENLDIATLKSVSLDGVSSHSARSFAIPRRHPSIDISTHSVQEPATATGMVRSSSHGALDSARNRKKILDSQKALQPFTLPLPKKKASDTAKKRDDSSRSSSKSPKRGRKVEADGTGKVRSSSLGTLRGAKARRKSSNGGTEQPVPSPTRTKGAKGKDASLDGSSHTVKSTRSRGRKKENESEGGKVRSSSLGTLRGAKARRQSVDKDDASAAKPTPSKGTKGKDESMDGSSHTMKSTKMRGRKKEVDAEGKVRSSSAGALRSNKAATRKKQQAENATHTKAKPFNESIASLDSIDTFSGESLDNLKASGKSAGKDKAEIAVDGSTRTTHSALTMEPDMDDDTSINANEKDAAENPEPENALQAKVAEMTSIYFEFKKKAAEVKKLKGEEDEDANETTGDVMSSCAVSARENGGRTSVVSRPSSGEPTSEVGPVSPSVSGPSVSGADTVETACIQTNSDVASLGLTVAKTKDELLAINDSISVQEQNADIVDQRMSTLKRQEEMFAAERAAFEMEKNMLAKERQTTTDERLTRILELEELLATERARFHKEKEAMKKESDELLEKERADFKKERETKQKELDSLSSGKAILEQQVEEEKQKNDDFKRVLDILSKQLESDGSVQLQTDDRLLQLAGLTDSYSELVTDDTMFEDEEEAELNDA